MAIVRCNLWNYYALEIPRLFGPKTMGPASGGEGAVFTVAMEHLLCSAVGGGAVLGIAWIVRTFRDRRRLADR